MSYNYTNITVTKAGAISGNNGPAITNISAGNWNTATTGYVNSSTNGSISPGFTFSYTSPSYILEIKDENMNEIVRIEPDGSVTWCQPEKFDQAAERFSSMLNLSAELAAKVTNKVKEDMMDAVFNDIFTVFADRESVTINEIKIAYESGKVFRKLKNDT